MKHNLNQISNARKFNSQHCHHDDHRHHQHPNNRHNHVYSHSNVTIKTNTNSHISVHLTSNLSFNLHSCLRFVINNFYWYFSITRGCWQVGSIIARGSIVEWGSSVGRWGIWGMLYMSAWVGFAPCPEILKACLPLEHTCLCWHSHHPPCSQSSSTIIHLSSTKPRKSSSYCV